MRRVMLTSAGLAAFSSMLAGQAGPSDRQKIDAAAAKRGNAVYSQHCVNCHGAAAKGTETAPDLIRSALILRDREGNELGTALKRLARHDGTLRPEQVADLSHFLKQQVEATARNRRPVTPPNVLTGDAKAGREYFEGAGGCSQCHSVTGDLAGIGRRYEPVELQQSLLFPSPKPLTATVTPIAGVAVTGEVVKIDDFDISLKDETGQYRTWARNADLTVEITDPMKRHHELLDIYTDQEIHNVVRYLESIK